MLPVGVQRLRTFCTFFFSQIQSECVDETAVGNIFGEGVCV